MIGRFLLTPSLPEYLMEFCKATLTFESADEILRCDHSNESSLRVLSHDAICLSKFLKMKSGNLVEICLRALSESSAWLFSQSFCHVDVH